MQALLNLWNEYTFEFSPVQKLIVGIVLGFIVTAALFAVVLLIMDLVNSRI